MRSRVRAIVGLTLLVGLAGGLVLGAVAAARRTDTAYPRFVAEHRASDVLKIGPLAVDPSEEATLDQIEALPQVEAATRAAYVFTVPLTPSGEPDFGAGIGQPLAPRNGWLDAMDQPKLLEGRRPSATQPEEMAVSYLTAQLVGLHVGDHLRLATWTPSESVQVLTGAPIPPGGPVITMTVVGIELVPGELAANTTDNAAAHFSSAFYERYRGDVGFASGSYVRLRRGAADVAAFVAAARGLLPPGVDIAAAQQAEITAKTQRSLHLPAVALNLFAVLAAVAGALILGQALSRELRGQAVDDETLRALGMSTTQRAAVGILVVVPVAMGGALIAVAVATALSPLSPIGLARVAEPHPGLSFDTVALLLGAGATALVVIAAGIIASWRASQLRPASRRGVHRRSRVADRASRASAPPSAVAGIQFAFESGEGRAAVPVRSTVAGMVLAVAAVATSFAFLASLQHLLDTPRLYGWNWDIVVGNPYASTDLQPVVDPVLDHDPAIRSRRGVGFASLEIESQQIEATAFDTTGTVGPAILNGRPPARSDELALATKTLRRLHLHVGDTVVVQDRDATAPMHIVGETVLANLSAQDNYGLGEGAALTLDGLRQLDPTAYRKDFLVQLQPGVRAEDELSTLRSQFHEGQISALLPSRPVDLDNFRRVDQAPLVLAGVLTLLAVATLTHALVSATKRRARDLAILKVLGFRRGQLRAVVAWQATGLALTASLVGLPLGIAVGRATWVVFAGHLGVVADPVTPIAMIALLPVAILIANLAAAIPGRFAAATRPALTLRPQ